ncbi:kinase-like protein [Xylariaceae sp. FL1272]|nr:kinase-like protein [Xylariaceae sp. FL1272]
MEAVCIPVVILAFHLDYQYLFSSNLNPSQQREREEAEAKGLEIPDSGPRLPRVEDDGTTVLHDFGGRRVSMSTDGVVTKKGLRVSLGEVEAMKTAIQAGVSCPTPYGAQTLDERRNAIQMSCVQGQTLDKMRALEPPPDLVGGCGSTSFRHPRAFDFAESPSMKNETALNDWLLSDMFKLTPSSIRGAFRATLRADHRIVFTDGDLGQRNIMVQDGKIMGLIDWEFAGWFPEYWEYVLFLKQLQDHADWREYATTIFSQPYYEELVQYWALSQLIRS